MLEYPLTIVNVLLFVILISLSTLIPEKLFAILFSLIVLTGIIIALFNYHNIRKIRGVFVGEIQFLKDRILINQNEYPLQSIEFIVFDVSDYYGKTNFGFVPIDPRKSNGTGNWVELILDNGKRIKTYFQLEFEDQFVSENKENLISYCKQNKISFDRLINILGISRKTTIENLKKELSQ